MSAFIVSKSHVDVIVQAALRGPRDIGEVRPDNVWHRFSWYAGNPRQAETMEAVNEMHRYLEAYGFDQTVVSPDALGAMLLGECIASVQYRYHGESVETLPGDVAENETWAEAGPDAYRFDFHAYQPTAVEALAAIDCLEYQSCEHPEWDDSEAKTVCDTLRRALIGKLPGYAAAPWEFTSERIAECKAGRS